MSSNLARKAFLVIFLFGGFILYLFFNLAYLYPTLLVQMAIMDILSIDSLWK